MCGIQQVSAAVVNYQTPALIDAAVRSFCRHYPDVPVLIIDNGSQDDSPAVIAALTEEFAPRVTSEFLPKNLFHGPAMHLAMERLQTPYVFMLDSDTETRRGGFLERMLELSAPANVYGVGKIVQVNRRGFAVEAGIPALVSAFMLLKKEVYHRLPPFVHHGLPALKNFEGAMREGYDLASFPVEECIEHFGRGTAERFGYGLGLKSRFDYLLNRLGL